MKELYGSDDPYKIRCMDDGKLLGHFVIKLHETESVSDLLSDDDPDLPPAPPLEMRKEGL